MLVNYTKASVLNYMGTYMIKPGVNRIEAKLWKEMKKHPTIAIKLESGELVEEQDAEQVVGDEKLAENNHLQDLKIPQAKALVEQTIDLELLESWLALEKRNQVKGSIQKQIKALTDPAQERDRSQSRQIDTGRGPVVENLSAKPNSQDD